MTFMHQGHQELTGGFLLLSASGLRETGYVPDGKNNNRCVIHHVSGGDGILATAVAGQSLPIPVGGNRRIG